ncbi:cardiolipin synthase [Paenibacillus thailandensis]|uniref:Cardiolipin synthase n=1 Tax=Paenibacillus thailandensis TaxID=393250 RepID=A0ABW5QSD3_9BACL
MADTDFWLILALIALFLYAVQIAVIIAAERKHAGRAVAWSFIALVCPFAGFAAYLIAERDFKRKKALRRQELNRLKQACELSGAEAFQHDKNEAEQPGQPKLAPAAQGGPPPARPLPNPDVEKLHHILTGVSQSAITVHNEVRVLTNGKEFFPCLLEDLARAKHHIHLDFYTIRDDGIGSRLLDVLTERARSGVEVRVLYDGLGSWQLSKTYISRLHEAGIRTSCFLPPRNAIAARQLNYRNHSKIAVIDGKIGFLGGINIGDEYLGLDPKLGFWRDTQLRLQGDAVYYLQELFMRHWAYAAGETLPFASYCPPHRIPGKERVLIVSGGPDSGKEPVLHAVFAAISSARERIWLTTPYFIPDPSLLTALRCAAIGGADVRMIVPGKTDHMLVLSATLAYARPLLASGVKIYRYRKGFIHSKVMLVDRHAAVIGTANMDMRSFYSNFEQNAFLFDGEAIDRLERDFLQDIADSEEMKPEDADVLSPKEKIKEAVSLLLSPLL